MVKQPGRAISPFAFAAKNVAMALFCSTLPMLATADSDAPDVLLHPDCGISSYCFPGKSATSNLSLNGGVNALFLEWRSPESSLFITGGMFANQERVGYNAGLDAIDPTSNISLKPLKPYIGTYLGLGLGQSSKKFGWMVDLGIAEQPPFNIVQNIQASSTIHTEHERTSTTVKWRLSSKRAAFSFRMTW